MSLILTSSLVNDNAVNINVLFKGMRLALFAPLGLLLVNVSAIAVEADSDGKLAEINRRIVSGDEQALKEVALLPPDVAVPYLRKCVALYKGRTERFLKVRQALRAVRGYDLYLKERLEKSTAKGDVDREAFEILGIIGTYEAAAVAAPYLFDQTIRDEEMNCILAANSLAGMELADKPQRTAIGLSIPDIIAWQKWVIQKGLVPEGWASRIGVPKALAEASGLPEVPPSTGAFIDPNAAQSRSSEPRPVRPDVVGVVNPPVDTQKTQEKGAGDSVATRTGVAWEMYAISVVLALLLLAVGFNLYRRKFR